MPSLSSFFPISKPGVSRSTMKLVMPRWPAAGSTLAMTRNRPASAALVIHSLRPVSTHASPSSTARVRSAKASLPAEASESAYEATTPPAICSSTRALSASSA